MAFFWVKNGFFGSNLVFRPFSTQKPGEKRKQMLKKRRKMAEKRKKMGEKRKEILTHFP